MLDFLFAPLLSFKPIIAVSLFSIMILIMINLMYKFLVNQSDSKQIKARIKELNEKMKEDQKNGKPTNEAMSEIMQENNKMMKMNMKPMLASFVIIILFLPWLSGTYGDILVPLEENTGELTIGSQTYQVQKAGEKIEIDSLGISCEAPCRVDIEDNKWNIEYFDNTVKFGRIIALLPIPLPLFGDDLGWLGWYFIFSIPIIILIRKILKIV